MNDESIPSILCCGLSLGDAAADGDDPKTNSGTSRQWAKGPVGDDEPPTAMLHVLWSALISEAVSMLEVDMIRLLGENCRSIRDCETSTTAD